MTVGDTRPGTPRKKTRERIIEAARELMSEKDILEVSISEITRRAGTNIASVSYHFGGREGLMVSLARADADFAIGELDKLVAAQMSPPDKIALHVAGIVRAYYRRPYLHRLLHKLIREGSREAATLVTGFFTRPVAEARRKIIRQGIEQGLFREVEPDLVGYAIEGACGHIYTSAASRSAVLGTGVLDEALVDRFARSTAELVVHGLLAPGVERDASGGS